MFFLFLCGWGRGANGGDTDDMGKVGSKRGRLLVQWEFFQRGAVVTWPRQHVCGMTFPLSVSSGCPAPGLGRVRARGQPHQTLSYRLSIFPHCAQR